MPLLDAAPLTVVDNEVEASTPATPLSKSDKAKLKRYEDEIVLGRKEEEDGKKIVAGGFLRMVTAVHLIHKDRLYRGNENRTFEAYCSERWHYSRAHGNRLVEMGQLLENHRMSPRGDILKSFTSAEHFLPLLSLSGGDQGRENVASNQDSGSRVIEALKKIETWKKSQAEQPITPRLVRSAVSVTNPPPAPEGEEDDVVADVRDHIGKAATDILKYIEKVRGALPEPKQKKTIAALKKMENKVAALGSRSRSTKISWTEATWNPLQGCTRASRGCDNCYAAKVIAVRKKHQYPGLAVAKTAKGVTTYSFTGKILLLQHALSEPLDDRIGKLFFVNSMSDLFHKDVPDDFIDEVFDVMERASWHVFQVLTKRPKHMADYTVRRYAEKTPPPNIWLGASTEDQEAFDTRYRDLLRVKTAVRWLSCEPLLGPLKMILKGIDWVVVGGESGKTDRKMAKSWATALRDQCKKGDIPFFFKQWGAFGEDGERVPYVRAKAKPKAKLDGVVHEYYPPQLKTVITNF